jgi:Microsomal signal peptidase 25 kDa subunit (SPC25)
VKKYDPTYNVVLRAHKAAIKTNIATVTIKKCFADWFDTEGTFVRKPFDDWLGQNVLSAEKQLAPGKRKKN